MRPLEIDRGVIAQPQHRFVQHAQQQPRHAGRRFFDFIEQHQRKIRSLAGHRAQFLLRQHRRRLAMPQISRRRADKLGHFMLHLEFAAVHAQQILFAAVQHIRQHLNRPRLARPRGTQQKKHARRPTLRRKPRAIHLDIRNNFRDRMRLPHQPAGDLLGELVAPVARRRGRIASRTDGYCGDSHDPFSARNRGSS